MLQQWADTLDTWTNHGAAKVVAIRHRENGTTGPNG
jgi:hypothetical protein